jgi:hypothetical protein
VEVRLLPVHIILSATLGLNLLPPLLTAYLAARWRRKQPISAPDLPRWRRLDRTLPMRPAPSLSGLLSLTPHDNICSVYQRWVQGSVSTPVGRFLDGQLLQFLPEEIPPLGLIKSPAEREKEGRKGISELHQLLKQY